MFGITRWRGTAKISVSLVLAMLLNLGSGMAPTLAAPKKDTKPTTTKLAGKISEVSPPTTIQQLHDLLDKYQPQVSIVSPRLDEVLQDNTVSVKFNVKDLPVYKDEKLGLGSHLHVFLDDQPYQAVYDASQPIVFKDLAAGTHTIRAFAGRPWHESFKNDGAYAQTTFHVFTKTPSNNPDPKQPLLTYSRPQATYGAEPVLLDFYLANAPLHIVAQEDDKDDVPDWKIRVTVNGDSFTLDRWQPIYLKGFKPGKNWVQLEYLDEKGNPVQNVYNNTARVFTYEPNGTDTLSKLVRDELPFDQAVAIVDPNYKPKAIIEPVPEVAPVPSVVEPTSEPEKPAIEQPTPKLEKPKGGFFNRFKRPTPEPSIAPTVEPSPEPEIPVAPIPPAFPDAELKQPEIIEPKAPEAPAVKEAPKGGFFDRFKRPTVTPTPTPIPDKLPEPETVGPPELIEPKVPEVPTVEPKPAVETEPSRTEVLERYENPESGAAPSELTEPETDTPEVLKPKPVQPSEKPAPKRGFFDRFRPAPKPKSPVAPELEAPVIEPAAPEIKTPTGDAVPEVNEPPAPEAPSPAGSIAVPEAPSAEPPKPSVEFQPQTELERRLGIPLNPVAPEPVKPSE